MCRKFISLIIGILFVSVALTGTAGAADPDLVGWWRFDEGSGTTAMDASGNGNDGALQGDTAWATGNMGRAVEFDGIDDFVEVQHAESLAADTEVTVMAWINTPRHMGPDSALWQGILSKGNNPFRSYSFYTRDGATLHFSVGPSSGYIGSGSSSSVPVPLNEWAHVCAMVIDDHHQYYINGEDAGTGGANSVLPGIEDTANVVIGRTQEGTGRSFLGRIDDVRIYMRGLTQEEVQGAMSGAGVPEAYLPSPANGAIHEDTWVTLSWEPGDFAVSHDVYLGDNFDDVDNGTADTFRGNQSATFYVAGFPGFAYPDGLVAGMTYYWRIDEVNDLHPDSPWKGEVWSFLIPPKKAYDPVPADGADSVPIDVRLNWTPGFGAKLHTVYFGDDFETVANATAGIPVGTTSYNPGPLKAAKLYYWRVDEFDAISTYQGDVWSFSTEGGITNPNPADGAVDVTQTPLLTWTAGIPAASHEIYLGTDAEAVRNATTASPEYKGTKPLGDESFDPGKLAWSTSYYWRVDEVNDTNPDSPWTGPIWSFTTASFAIVEDFESYTDNDADGEAIWQSWIDGFGVADNGSQVGYLLPPYAEQTIVHGGLQSMPLFYNNEGGVANSEAVRTLTSTRDWTEEGVTELSLWFHGLPGSVGSFTEAPAGTYTMTASGTDIWDVGTAGDYRDEFHFAYKTLTGAGSITARVMSVQNTDPWAKAGVMIRETLEGGSKHAFACITPGNGVASQGRATTGAASFNANQTGITAPHWVKLERSASGSLTVSHSANGTTWQAVTGATPQNISMSSNVYIGLALTAHNAAATCEAVFSNVTTTGTVSGQWMNQDIGMASNAAEPLYVAVSNAAGSPAVVAYDDPAAATIDDWVEWRVPLQAFADQGINLSNVDQIAVGLGNKSGLTSPGGSGTMYIDDIRLYRPSETAASR